MELSVVTDYINLSSDNHVKGLMLTVADPEGGGKGPR